MENGKPFWLFESWRCPTELLELIDILKGFVYSMVFANHRQHKNQSPPPSTIFMNGPRECHIEWDGMGIWWHPFSASCVLPPIHILFPTLWSSMVIGTFPWLNNNHHPLLDRESFEGGGGKSQLQSDHLMLPCSRGHRVASRGREEHCKNGRLSIMWLRLLGLWLDFKVLISNYYYAV